MQPIDHQLALKFGWEKSCSNEQNLEIVAARLVWRWAD